MQRIEKLLKLEEASTRESTLIFKGLGDGVDDALEFAAEIYALIAATLDKGDIDRMLVDIEHKYARTLNRKEIARANRRLDDATTKASAKVKTAVTARTAMWAWFAQKIAFQFVLREFNRGATDLKRLRISSTLGHLRQQVEAAALIDVFRHNPRRGIQWVDHATDHLKLFWQLHDSVLKALDRHNLRVAYDWGSSVGMHPSFLSAAPGISFKSSNQQALVVALNDQEFQHHAPFQFHLTICYFLRGQERIAQALSALFPGMDQPRITDAIANLAVCVEKLWWVLGRKYPEDVARIQQQS